MNSVASARDPRALALEVLLDWNPDRGDFIDRLVHRRLREFDGDGRDRAFLTELAYGVVRHRNTLAQLARSFLDRPDRLNDRTLEYSLFLGFYQCVYLKTPAHAMVDSTLKAYETVARKQRKADDWLRKAKGLLNAVLRNATREVTFEEDSEAQRRDPHTVRVADGWARCPRLELPGVKDHLAAVLGFKYSHPTEVVRLWLERFGEEEAVRIFDHDNRDPVTQLVVRRDAELSHLARKLRLLNIETVERAAEHLIEVRGAGAIDRLPGFDEGLFWVQDRTARRLAQLMPEQESSTLLDLCAAPGGKLMTLLDGREYRRVVACDVSMEKLRLVASNLDRMGWTRRVELQELPPDPDRIQLREKFRQVIVDAPCSNSGVLNRRVDARWRILPEALRELQQLQLKLLTAAARHVELGGDLVYSTCSIEPSENEDVVQRFLSRHSGFRLVEELSVLPGDRAVDEQGVVDPDSPAGDGGYGVLMRRTM